MSYLSRPLSHAALRYSSALGRPVAATNSVSFSNGTSPNSSGQQFGGTCRVQYNSGSRGLIDISAVFQNWASANQSGEAGITSTYTIKNVVLESPNTSDTLQYLFFPGGSKTADINQYATTPTDPYKIMLPPNTIFFLRWFFTCENGTHVPSPPQFLDPTQVWNNCNAPTAADLTGQSGTTGLTQNVSNLYVPPTAIIGTPMFGQGIPTVGLFGDSLFDNSGPIGTYKTWPALPLLNAGNNIIKAAIQGDLATGNVSNAATRCRNNLLADCDAVIVGFGTNDLRAGDTVANIIAAWKAMWTRYISYGCQVWQTTIVPQTTGSWASTTTQTPYNVSGAEAKRQALNAYLRAPITAGAGNSALADGLALGGGGVIDVAAYIETDVTNKTPNPANPSNGGLWWCGASNGTAMTNDGIHPNLTGIPLLSASIPIGAIGFRSSIPTQYT